MTKAVSPATFFQSLTVGMRNKLVNDLPHGECFARTLQRLENELRLNMITTTTVHFRLYYMRDRGAALTSLTDVHCACIATIPPHTICEDQTKIANAKIRIRMTKFSDSLEAVQKKRGGKNRPPLDPSKRI